MDFESYKKALLAEEFDELTVEHIVDEYYHSGIPHVFKGDAVAHGQFRRALANEIGSAFGIGCHPHDVVVCGSAHLGFSAAPNEKLGTPFNFTESDVDVAILLSVRSADGLCAQPNGRSTTKRTKPKPP